jgi:hypothetical protein
MTAGGRHVAIVLMKGEHATATIDVLEADQAGIQVQDNGTYYKLECDDEIYVDMGRVGQELGRPLALSEWLVTLVSFVGRAAPGADYFRVTSQMTDLDDNYPLLGSTP